MEKAPLASHRPVTWPDEIQAPKAAVEFYRALAKISEGAPNEDAFDVCHIWQGKAMNGTAPVIRWRGKVRSMVRIFQGYLGIPSGKRTCGTERCINPFHHTPFLRIAEEIMVTALPPPTPTPRSATPVEEFVELIEYTIDRYSLKPPHTFESLRGSIDPDDLMDAQLKMALESMTK